LWGCGCTNRSLPPKKEKNMQYEKESTEQEFKNVSFENDLIGFRFDECSFSNCSFDNIKLNNSRFIECSFDECSFSNIEAISTSFPSVQFKNCKIVGVDFSTCDQTILNLRFSNSKLMYCNFQKMKLKKAEFGDCEIQECDFYKANLENSNFENSNLEGSIFEGTTLIKANLKNAKNYIINPNMNEIRGAIFSIPEVLTLLKPLQITIE
jgi:uncharacterized protein YjbI with pentapeptide repeats